MTLFDTAPDDVADVLIRLDRRLREVEQTLGDPTAVVGKLPTQFPESGITIGTTPVNENVEEVTALTVTVSAFFNDNVANFEWDSPGATAREYEIEVVRWDEDDEVWVDPRYVRTGGTAAQMGGLRSETHYGAKIWTINSLGRRSDSYPAGVDYEEFDTGNDSTIPNILTGAVVARGAASVVVMVSESTDVDVANGRGLYQFQIDTVNTFDSPDLKNKKDAAFITAFENIVDEDAWYGRIRAIDEFGNEGPWVVAGPSTAGGVVDAMIVTGLDAGKITVGYLNGGRIEANTASVGILTTSSLTSADITLAGGSLKAGSPPTTGLLLNSQGLRLYQGGVQTMTLDAATGAATFRGNMTAGTITIGSNFSVDASGNMVASNAQFSGNITATDISGGTIQGTLYRSATSGARVEIQSGINNAGVEFYTANGKKGAIGYAGTTSGVNRITIAGPASGSSSPNVIELNDVGSVSISSFLGGSFNLSGFSSYNMDSSVIASTSYVNFIVGNYTPLTGTHQGGVNTSSNIQTSAAMGCNTIYAQAGVFTSKPFYIPHPVKGKDWALRYMALEGPTQDVVHRGRVTMEASVVLVDLDAEAGLTAGTFNALTYKDNRQVMLYNENGTGGTHEWVGPGKFEIHAKKGDIVAWVVYAERKGYPDMDGYNAEGKVINEELAMEMAPWHDWPSAEGEDPSVFLDALEVKFNKERKKDKGKV